MQTEDCIWIFIPFPKEQNRNLNFYAHVTDVSGGYSPSILDAIRNTLDVSIHISYGKGSKYAPLTYHEAFYLATLGGARGR
jgi:cytosine/adenosine deaminase-related metal-dependent hydrolase